MEAGRELDALIAEKVMGWTLVGSPEQQRQGCAQPPDESPDSSRGHSCPYYSTDIAAALEVVEKDDGWGFNWRLKRWAASSKPWTCTAYRITDGRRFCVEAVTAPLAICLVALRAVE